MAKTDLNTVALIGRLGQHAELKTSQYGTVSASFCIAVNRQVKKNDQYEEHTDWYDCVLYGKLAEALAQYMTKGTQLSIQGSLRQERWEDEHGGKHSRIRVVAQQVQLLGSPDRQSPPQQHGYRQVSPPEEQQSHQDKVRQQQQEWQAKVRREADQAGVTPEQYAKGYGSESVKPTQATLSGMPGPEAFEDNIPF